MRAELSETTEGWCVEISSLTPCDAMMALAREDLLEKSTILSGGGGAQWVACVHGPVELGDAKAIVHEVEHSDFPLCADFRMQSIVTSKGGDSVLAHVRNYDDALTLVGTMLLITGTLLFMTDKTKNSKKNINEFYSSHLFDINLSICPTVLGINLERFSQPVFVISKLSSILIPISSS